MAGITDIFFRFLNPKKKILWILLTIILIVIGIVYIYKNYKNNVKSIPKINDIPNANSSTKDIVFSYFYADWCPHCKKAKDPWNSFTTNMNGKVVNGYKIMCKSYDCSDTGNLNIDTQTQIDKYEVKGYPSIKVDKDGKIIDFDAKITEHSLSQFIESMI